MMKLGWVEGEDLVVEYEPKRKGIEHDRTWYINVAR